MRRALEGSVAGLAEKVSETWHVSPAYLLQAHPGGNPISISGEALTWQDAQRASMRRLFGFDTWNGQHRTTKLAELLLHNIHCAIHQLSWGSYYSRKKKPARPPKRYRELKGRLVSGEELSDTERSELETLGKKWAKKKDTDFRSLRAKGHEAAERFLFDALAAIHQVLDRHNLPHEVLPGFDTRYTAILQDVLEDPEAPIVCPSRWKREVAVSTGNRTVAAATSGRDASDQLLTSSERVSFDGRQIVGSMEAKT